MEEESLEVKLEKWMFDWLETIPEEHESKIIEAYNAYIVSTRVNRKLINDNYMDSTIKLMIDLAPSLTFDLNVYRGITDEKYLAAEWTEKGFLSTTYNIDRACEFTNITTGGQGCLLRFTIPEGTKCVFQDAITENGEEEIIVVPYQIKCTSDKEPSEHYEYSLQLPTGELRRGRPVYETKTYDIPIYDIYVEPIYFDIDTLGLSDENFVDKVREEKGWGFITKKPTRKFTRS